MERDNDLPQDAPTASAVAKRACILTSVACRGHIERSPTDPEAVSLHSRLPAWLDAIGLTSALEPEERFLFQAPLGELDRRRMIAATWQIEGAAVLAWALQRYSLPLRDAKVDPFAIADALEFLDTEAARIVQRAALRARSQLDAYRELIYAIHCRLREVKRRPQRGDFERWLDPRGLQELGLSLDDLVAEGDLSLAGGPLHQADSHRVQLASEITYERHRAAIWLMGEQPDYWRLTVDT